MFLPPFPAVYANASPGAGAAGSVSYSEHKPKTPPPDLPSLLLDSRIVYLGMPVRHPGSALCAFWLQRGWTGSGHVQRSATRAHGAPRRHGGVNAARRRAERAALSQP